MVRRSADNITDWRVTVVGSAPTPESVARHREASDECDRLVRCRTCLKKVPNTTIHVSTEPDEEDAFCDWECLVLHAAEVVAITSCDPGEVLPPAITVNYE